MKMTEYMTEYKFSEKDLANDELTEFCKKFTPRFIIRCPNCQKEHPLAWMAARVTCVCNYVFDPREIIE